MTATTLVRDELVGSRDGLLAIAIVVGGDHLDLLAEQAALGVEFSNRSLGALPGSPRPPTPWFP